MRHYRSATGWVSDNAEEDAPPPAEGLTRINEADYQMQRARFDVELATKVNEGTKLAAEDAERVKAEKKAKAEKKRAVLAKLGLDEDEVAALLDD